MNPPLFKIWLNPFFRRYAVARLRWQPLLIWSVIVHGLGAFGWLSTFYGSTLLDDSDIANAARRAWIPVLVIQGLLLIVKGTFSIAVGIAREHAEGLSDAQRLTPLSPGHKVLGSLFGLPILDSLLALSLLPWTVASVVLGHIPLDTVFRIHLLLATSAVLHHAIGLVSGTIIRQKIAAGTVSQLLVIFLHGIIPLFSKVGIGTLGHLGIETTIAAELAQIFTPQYATVRNLAVVKFFNFNLSAAGYQWIAMMLLLCVLLSIVYRRWFRAEAHLLNKTAAFFCTVALLITSLGELTPELQAGIKTRLPKFLTSRLDHSSAQSLDPELPLAQQAISSVAALAAFGSIGLGITLLLTVSVAPTPMESFRSARARLFADPHPQAAADARSAVPVCLAMTVVVVGAWLFLIQQAQTPVLLRTILKPHSDQPVLLFFAVLVPLISWCLLIELRGRKIATLCLLGFWIAAPLAAIVCGLAGVSLNSWPRWLFASSGLTLPSVALFNSFQFSPTELETPWLVSIGFHSGLSLLLGLLLGVRNKKQRTADTITQTS